MERILPVWREEYRSFSRSFKKSFVLDTFQAISVKFFNSRHTKMARECNEDFGNVQVMKLCQFFLDFLVQCNFLAITACFTQQLDTQMLMWVCSISVSCQFAAGGI